MNKAKGKKADFICKSCGGKMFLGYGHICTPEKSKHTDLEQKVIDAYKSADDFENMPTFCAEDLSNHSGIDMKTLRGVLSSLIKKDLIRLGEYPNGLTAFHLKQ